MKRIIAALMEGDTPQACDIIAEKGELTEREIQTILVNVGQFCPNDRMTVVAAITSVSRVDGPEAH